MFMKRSFAESKFMSRYGHLTDHYSVAAQRHVGIFLVLLSAFLYSPAGVFTKAVEAGAWSVLFWRGAGRPLLQ